MQNISLETAQHIANNALKAARVQELRVSVSIVDTSGRLVVTMRDTGAGFFTADTSKAKAVASAAFGKPTSELVALRGDNPFWSEVSSVLKGEALATTGGMPILDNSGHLTGAIGIGGGSPEQDESIAKEALKAI